MGSYKAALRLNYDPDKVGDFADLLSSEVLKLPNDGGETDS